MCSYVQFSLLYGKKTVLTDSSKSQNNHAHQQTELFSSRAAILSSVKKKLKLDWLFELLLSFCAVILLEKRERSLGISILLTYDLRTAYGNWIFQNYYM